MADELQKPEEVNPVPLKCPSCGHPVVRRTFKQAVHLVETYRDGELVDTETTDYDEVLKGGNSWVCEACDQTWYWPPRRLTLRIEQDADAESPREFDNLGIMVCFHNRYNLGDKTDLKSSMFDGWEELAKHLQEEEEATHILPLYLYDHSGITMSTGPFSCRWDSGQVGFIYTTAKRIAEMGVAEENIEQQLEAEVKVYDQYLQGDVWGYIIEDEDGEQLDSCWGFYGREDAESEARAAMEHV
jgi:hypothetical protein